VVFEISPSHVKTFHYPPRHFDCHHHNLPTAVRRLCVGSAESKDQQVRRPHHVQVQSPISRTGPNSKEWIKAIIEEVGSLIKN